MKSCYGFWLLSVCWISLTGCANWQSRAGGMNSPGSAASLTAAPAPLGPPAVQGPGPMFGEPPPPMPPASSDPGMNLAPLGSPSTEKLNLAASPADDDSPGSGKMYNLDTASKSTKSKSSRSVASVSDPAPKKSSTISKMAVKSSTSKTKTKSDSSEGMSTISRLSKNASKESDAEVAVVRPATKSDTEALPVPKSVDKPEEVSTEEASTILDTTLMAQPVRKGAASKGGSSDSNSDGPQSNAAQGRNNFKPSKATPLIYPVSNPVVEQPVNIMEFS